jgi:predicted PurR-regulated permease PerM
MLAGVKSYLSVDFSKTTAIISLVITLALMLILVHSFIGSSTSDMAQKAPMRILKIFDNRLLAQYVHAISVVQPEQNSTISSSDLLAQGNTLNTIFNQAQKSIVTITTTLPTRSTATPESQNIAMLRTGFVYDNQGHIISEVSEFMSLFVRYIT